MLQCTGHPHLLAGSSDVDPGTPAQPVGARAEARVPSFFRVELTDQHQESVGGRVQVCGQLGDLVAQALEVLVRGRAGHGGERGAGVAGRHDGERGAGIAGSDGSESGADHGKLLGRG